MEKVTISVPVYKLIVLVSEHSELYDMSVKLYHNIHHKEAVWSQIGRILGVSGDVCRQKWKYLRDKYKREKRDEKNKRSGSEGGLKRPWKYMGILSFLDPHVQDRPTATNFESPDTLFNAMCENTEESENLMEDTLLSRPPTPGLSDNSPSPPCASSVANPPPAPTPKRKKDSPPPELSQYQKQVVQALNPAIDEHEHFMLSFVPIMRRFEPRKQAMARVKIQSLFFDLEFGE